MNLLISSFIKLSIILILSLLGNVFSETDNNKIGQPIKVVSPEGDPQNYLKISNKIKFNLEDYYLKWSSHPSKGYYKQEYLRKSDEFPDFNRMIIYEFIKSVGAKGAVQDKIRELDLRKSDPVLKYELIEGPDGKQFILDFLISDGNTYEWNIYKYTSVGGKANILFGFSLRSSQKGELDGYQFFDFLKANRTSLINKMISTKVPECDLCR